MLDFIVSELTKNSEPLEVVTILKPVRGQVWITLIEKAKEEGAPSRYQAQCSSVNKLEMVSLLSGDVIVTSSAGKVAIKPLKSDVDGCFDILLSDEDAALISRQKVSAYQSTLKDLYSTDNLPSDAALRLWIAQSSEAKLYNRARPISNIFLALNTIDYNVGLWESYAMGEIECPEFDLDGNLLSGNKAEERYQFWLDAQNAIAGVAQKAAQLQLANPIDAKEFTLTLRKLQIEMILAALQMPSNDASFDWLGSEGVSRFLAEIKKIWAESDKLPSAEPSPLESSEGEELLDPKEDLRTESPKKSKKSPL